MTTTQLAVDLQELTPVQENQRYKEILKKATADLRKGGQIQKYDPEWLVRRGNYYTIITPEIAGELLDRNRKNRKPKRRAIAQYAADMMTGEWNADASTIEVDRLGDLINGQNRLMACLEAGVPFPTLLRTGLDPDARNHIDQGARRTSGDTLAMAGLADANVLSAAINIRARYELTVREFGGQQTMSYARSRRISMTHAEVLAYVDAHPSIDGMAGLGRLMAQVGPGVPRSVHIAALSMFAETSEKMAREFAEAFIEGESSGTGDPILALTRYLARAKSPAEMRTKSRNKNLQHLAAFVKAWNAWVQSEKVDKIKVSDHDLFEQPV